MTWTRLDEHITDHPKILSVSPFAELMHYRALVYCNRLGTDGVVAPAALPVLTRGLDAAVAFKRVEGELFDTWSKPEPQALVAELVRARLWEKVVGKTCWKIHDFGDYQPLRAELEERQRGFSEAGRRGGLASGAARRDQMSSTRSLGLPLASSHTKPEPEPEPVPNPNGTHTRASAGAVEAVFLAWASAAGKGARTQLDAKRRRLIAGALKLYPASDVIDAVRGWRHSPHHRGENDRATVYNDLELLLRDARHIEMFRDLEIKHRSAATKAIAEGPSAPDPAMSPEEKAKAAAARARLQKSVAELVAKRTM